MQQKLDRVRLERASRELGVSLEALACSVKANVSGERS